MENGTITPSSLNSLAWAYNEVGDDRALEVARKALRLNPESGYVLDTLGWILIKRGYVREGIANLQYASKLLPENGEIKYHLATALFYVGEHGLARTTLENITATEPGPKLSAEIKSLRKKISEAETEARL